MIRRNQTFDAQGNLLREEVVEPPPPTALEAARAELDRAVAVAAAPEKLATVNSLTLAAEGVTDGQPWRQPQGAHDAYPQGFTVTHGGKTWESTTPANVWAPGTANWREIVPAGSAPPAWVQPSGSTDAYKIGDRVTFQSKIYESVINANVWSPTAYPAGWKLIP